MSTEHITNTHPDCTGRGEWHLTTHTDTGGRIVWASLSIDIPDGAASAEDAMRRIAAVASWWNLTQPPTYVTWGAS